MTRTFVQLRLPAHLPHLYAGITYHLLTCCSSGLDPRKGMDAWFWIMPVIANWDTFIMPVIPNSARQNYKALRFLRSPTFRKYGGHATGLRSLVYITSIPTATGCQHTADQQAHFLVNGSATPFVHARTPSALLPLQPAEGRTLNFTRLLIPHYRAYPAPAVVTTPLPAWTAQQKGVGGPQLTPAYLTVAWRWTKAL